MDCSNIYLESGEKPPNVQEGPLSLIIKERIIIGDRLRTFGHF